MKVLLWWPGATVAVSDVAAGLSWGLEQCGVELVHYRTDAHIVPAGHTLRKLWQKAGSPKDHRPSPADVLYQANQGILDLTLRTLPDWVVAVSGMYQHPDYFVLLRRMGVKVALVCTESPYEIDKELRIAPHVDHVFTNERTATPAFREVNPHVTYVPHAWHPGVHGVMAAAPVADVPAHDVVYVGTLFIERVRLLEAIDWTGINLGLYGTTTLIGPRHRLRASIRGGDTPNDVTAALYRQAALGLNLHRTSVQYGRQVAHIAGAESINPRCYELAACGVPFVTDARAEVAEVFGSAVPTFTSPAEAAGHIRRLLADAEARAAVAAACHAAVAPHHWAARAAGVVAALEGQTVAVAA